MASATLVSVSEYLRSDYEPDAEFVDGRIEERPMGEFDHSGLQTGIASFLNNKSFRLYFRPFTELRVRVSDQRFRVPDICVVKSGAPRERVLQTPPLLCIEILSPEDTMSRTMTRVRDFLAMGVPEVWIVDSESRTVQVCAGDIITVHTAGHLPIPGTPITLALSEIFSPLDE